jgi:hypothetical protein
VPVHFSDREMKNAWKHNFEAYKKLQPSYTNAHRLLLFYSTECGLKATLMKRESANNTEDCASLIALIKGSGKDGHNINKLLDALCAGHDLKLPPEISMTFKRTINCGEINQMWRYGGKVANIKNQNRGLVDATDEDLEKCLLKISEWIKQEL